MAEYGTLLDIRSTWSSIVVLELNYKTHTPFSKEKEISNQIMKCWNSDDFDTRRKGQRFKGKLFLHGRIHHVSKSGKQTSPRSIDLLYYFKNRSWSPRFCILITKNKYLQWQSKSWYDFAWIRSGKYNLFTSRKAMRTKIVFDNTIVMNDFF